MYLKHDTMCMYLVKVPSTEIKPVTDCIKEVARENFIFVWLFP